MNTDNATDLHTASNKRKRSDVTASNASGTKTASLKSPKAIAESFITGHVASLQPQIAIILKKLGEQHIKLLHNVYNKTKQITRMEDDYDFIPRSARLEFKFFTSKKAAESPEFIALKEETDHLIIEFRKVLKRQIITATKIERNTLQQDIQVDFVKAIRLVAEAFIICQDLQDVTQNDMVSSIMSQHHEALLKHTNLSYESFCTLYKGIHNVTIFPTINNRRQHSNATQHSRSNTSAYFSPRNNNQNTQNVTQQTNDEHHQTEGSDIVKRMIESVFVTSFDEYIKKCKTNEIDISLKKLSTTHFIEESTNRTLMDIDDEPAVGRENLQELIQKQTVKENKLLHKEMTRLREQVKGLLKNDTRGRNGGASVEKQITRRNPNSKSNSHSQKKSLNQRKHPDQRVDVSGSASSNNSSKQRRKKGQQNGGGKKKPSTTRKNR